MNFRCPKLLAMAKEAPHCMYCTTPNYGQVVGAHSNLIKHGKGTGIKAHDIPAYICNHCHDIIDGRVPSSLTKDGKMQMFLDAVYNTVVWLLQTGRLVVA